MQTVVTGGAGFIGSHLVDALLARGDQVTVIDNLHRGRLSYLAAHRHDPRLVVRIGDIRDPALLTSSFGGADAVFHLAAQSNVLGALQDVRYSFESNVTGTFNVLQAVREAGVRRVVFTSSREAYGEAGGLPVDEEQPLRAKNLYGASKAAAELYCQAFGTMADLELVILRLANVYGPRDEGRVIPRFIERARSGAPLELYGGGQILDFVWVEQVVEALLRAVALPVAPQPINIGSGVGTTIAELAQRVIGLSRSASRIIVHPARPAEVTRFVADVRRMQVLLDLVPSADPLGHLPAMIEASGVEVVR